MIDVFLSASVPLPDRNRIFFDTADVLAIREAIKALIEVILPVGRITCGGHPAITPLLALFVREAKLEGDRIFISQSDLFKGQYPPTLAKFINVKTIPAVAGDRNSSLTAMREEMISSKKFAAAVIVGGMEGIYEEVDLFKANHPDGLVLPLATTGAAAAIVYSNGSFDKDLAVNRTYSSLFRRKILKTGGRISRP